jgi:hypothetical protein
MTARAKKTARRDATEERETNDAMPAGTTPPQEREVPIPGREPFGHWGEEVGRFVAGTVSSVRHLGETGTRQRSRANAAEGEVAGERTTRQRAEVLVDDFGDWTKRVGSLVTRQVTRLASRAREEGEDIWAEARAVQRHEREPSAPPAESEPHASAE